MTPTEPDPLDRMLKTWTAPPAPATLEARVFPRRSFWHWLLAGDLRIPVPVAAGLLIAVLTAAVLYSRRPPMPSVTHLADFEPVKEFQPKLTRRN